MEILAMPAVWSYSSSQGAAGWVGRGRGSSMLVVKTQTMQGPQSHQCLRRGTTRQGEKLLLRVDGQGT